MQGLAAVSLLLRELHGERRRVSEKLVQGFVELGVNEGRAVCSRACSAAVLLARAHRPRLRAVTAATPATHRADVAGARACPVLARVGDGAAVAVVASCTIRLEGIR